MNRARWLSLPCAAMVLWGCTEEFANVPDVPVTTRNLAAWPDTMLVGDTLLVTIQVAAEHGAAVDSTPMQWRSSDQAVIEIIPLEWTAQGVTAWVIAREPGAAALAVQNTGGNGLAAGLDSAEIVVMERWLSVEAGDTYTCGITGRHVGYCWGGIGHGLGLGNGLSDGSDVPVRVATVSALPLFAITAAFGHTCALASATFSAGFPYCWGFNGDGTLGNGTQTSTVIPTPVDGGRSFSEISTGDGLTCAADGTLGLPVFSGFEAISNVSCWGLNAFESSLTPSDLPLPIDWPLDVNNFVLRGITVGRAHACGLLDLSLSPDTSAVTGNAYCWGFNFSGQLGDSTTDGHDEPEPVVGGLSFTAISAGDVHTCGISDGRLFCWGQSQAGELGEASDTSVLAPVEVQATGLRFTAISAAGGDIQSFAFAEFGGHNCALATDGLAYCWGRNFDGELGIGTRGPDSCPLGPCSLLPRAVVGGLRFASISSAEGSDLALTSHTCGITAIGALYCWGDNGKGQLGNPDGGNVPTRVLNPK